MEFLDQEFNILLDEKEPIDIFLDHVSRNVVKDKVLLKTILLTIFSSQTDNPLNLFLKGETSTGKTFAVKNIVSLFKNRDCNMNKKIWVLGKLSPTAIYYDKGELWDLENNKRITIIKNSEKNDEYYYEDDLINCLNGKMEKDEIQISKLIDLTGITLIFYESPSYDTLMMLRAILSHDNDEFDMEYKITKDQSVMTVFIRGSPASIFCQAQANKEYNSMDEIASRCVTVSPDESSEKYREVIKRLGHKYSFGEKPKNEMRERSLSKLINAIVELTKYNKANSTNVMTPLANSLYDKLPSTQGSDMRHADQYCQLIKLHTWFNAHKRPIIVNRKNKLHSDKVIFSTQQDYEFLIDLLELFGNTIRGGIPKTAVELYMDFIVPTQEDGVTTKELSTMLKKSKKFRSPKQLLKHELAHLKNENWIESIQSPEDKRVKIFRSITNDTDVINDMVFINNNKLIEFTQDHATEYLKQFQDSDIYSTFQDSIEYQVGISSTPLTKTEFINNLISIPKQETKIENSDISDNGNITETNKEKQVGMDTYDVKAHDQKDKGGEN